MQCNYIAVTGLAKFVVFCEQLTQETSPLVEQSARPVRRVVSRLVTTYESLITTIERWVEWGNTAQLLLADL
jgi:hypothetical protein